MLYRIFVAVKSFLESKYFILIAIIGIIGLVISAVYDMPISYYLHFKPTPTPRVMYIYVVDSVTNNPVPSTTITITSLGKTPVMGITDENGKVSFSDWTIHPEQPSTVYVKVRDQDAIIRENIIFPTSLSPITFVVSSLGNPPVSLFSTPSNFDSTHIHLWLKTPTPISSPIVPSYAVEEIKFIDQQLKESLNANIVFNKPKLMKIGDTESIELLLNPSMSTSDLLSQLAENNGYLTSPADPSTLFSPNGQKVETESSNIQITLRTKVEIKAQDAYAFSIEEMHDSAEQVISDSTATQWRWSITALKEGPQVLELIVYRLVKFENRDYWREVETYRATILVKVTTLQRIRTLDWKWVFGILITLLLVPAFWRWIDNKHKAKETNQPLPRRLR